MGHASLGIYVHELYSFYGVKNIIRVGTCGGISPNVKVGDIVVAMSSFTDGAVNDNLTPGFRFAPMTGIWLKKFVDQNPDAHVGPVCSNDYFYQPNQDWWKCLRDVGVLGVDMETAMLYSIGNETCQVCISSESSFRSSVWKWRRVYSRTKRTWSYKTN